jgi:hypothetical protein
MNLASGQPLRIAATLAWEFFARGWRGILLTPLAATLLPTLLLSVLRWRIDSPALRGEVAVLFQFAFFWPTLLFLGANSLQAQGNPKLRYTLPGSSLVLVATPMICAMATTFVQYAIFAMAMNALFGAGWSIWGPGLLAAVLVAWCQAVLWSTWNSPGLQFATCFVSFISLLVAIGAWAPPHGGRFLAGPNGWHVLTFGLATLACVGVGSAGFAALRHGSCIDVKRLVEWLSERIALGKAARATPFSSALSAQFWLEWTERGRVLPIGGALFGTGALVAFYCCWAITGANFDGQGFIAGVATLSLIPLSVIGFLWGSRSPNHEFGAFQGSRPLSDRQIAHAILKSATLAFVLTALIWVGNVAWMIWIVGERNGMSKPYQALQQAGAWRVSAIFTLCAIAAWSATGLMTSLALAGKRVLLLVICPGGAVALAGALLPHLLPTEYRDDIAGLYWTGCLIFCLAGCLAIFIVSWRRRLIDARTLWLSAILVGIGACATFAARQPGVIVVGKHLLLTVACCSLIPIPLAAAPLAVYWNRHR